MEMLGGVIAVAKAILHQYAEKRQLEVLGFTVPQRITGALSAGQWTIGRMSVLIDHRVASSAGRRPIGRQNVTQK